LTTPASSTSPTQPAGAAPSNLRWVENGIEHSVLWRSERGASPPKKVQIADDTTPADAAYRLACEGTALLWRGDFQNARQLLQALARRIDKGAMQASRRAASRLKNKSDQGDASAQPGAPITVTFHEHRQAQAQRARVLGMLVIALEADYRIDLRRAPDVHLACSEVWGTEAVVASVVSLRDVLAMVGAHEWRKKGVAIAALGEPPNNRIHPHYGVFSPQRGEYIDLVAHAPLPSAMLLANRTVDAACIAFDIGTGAGVLAAVLARRGIEHTTATDQDPRALACARENLERLGLTQQVQLEEANLFPAGRAALVVCNPPWLPARPSAPIERAVYDEGSRMLLGFLAGLRDHLAEGGEGWLILSDLAERLGLRSREMLLNAITEHGLQVLGRLDAKPLHAKAFDPSDALHAARSKEVTSLWRLGAMH
jgi:SAM-dependent methyltransferase